MARFQACVDIAALIRRWLLAGLLVLLLAANTTALLAADASVLKHAQPIFSPLPGDAATPEHPITPERVELGRKLFFDPRISDAAP